MRLKAAGEEAVYPAPVDLPVVLLPPDDDEDGPPVPAPTSTASSGPVSPDAKDRIGYLGVRMFLKMFVDDVRINDGFIKVSRKKKLRIYVLLIDCSEPQNRRWRSVTHPYSRYYRHFRSQSEGMRPYPTRASSMGRTRHF